MVGSRCLPADEPFDFKDQATSRTGGRGFALCGIVLRALEVKVTEINVDDEYRAGFIEGFKSARGDDVADPEIPEKPSIPNEKKAHNVGWHDGRLHGLDATVPDDPKDSK
jgi:hypothetical protein